MRLLLLLLALGVAAPATAQQPAPPYPVSGGDYVRLELASAAGMPEGAYLVGRVRSAGVDSVTLASGRQQAVQAVAWAHVVGVSRQGENRAGEVLGMLLGGMAGGLAGYVLGEALSDDPLAGLALIPGAFGGLLVGGVVGANVGERWQDIPPASPALGFRTGVTLR